MTTARTQARCRRCGTSNSGVQGIVDQFGNSYGDSNGSGIFTVPNYGPNPTVKLQGDDIQGRSEPQLPFRILQDPNDPYCFTIRWAATQVGRNLVAADGTTVLYTAPPETPLVINGANQQGQPTTFGGLTTTPSGTAGHNPTMVLAFDQENPPSWFVNDDGEIESGGPAADSCISFAQGSVDWAAGPGASPNNAASHVVNNQSTFVCVTDSPYGALRVFVIDQDVQGDWQWRGPV